MSHNTASAEKSKAALSSVAAAVGLTAFKLVVGLLTNSLGILAEAAHSGLDLVAALMTFLAVRIADKPADQKHQFGHGKVENLSALFETVLLLITSAWIIYEAYQRLFVETVEVDASIWAFIVMGTSIVIDVNRSRMLYAAARKHNSQALEADALHFSTDIWSSAVVLIGLAGVSLARFIPGLAWMGQADAVAAMVVALIVVYVSGEMGWRTIQALLDTAPAGKSDEIVRAVEALKGVVNCHGVRIRPSGAVWFVDLHINVDGEISLNAAHTLSEKVEQTVGKVLPRAEVTVHVEPAPRRKKPAAPKQKTKT